MASKHRLTVFGPGLNALELGRQNDVSPTQLQKPENALTRGPHRRILRDALVASNAPTQSLTQIAQKVGHAYSSGFNHVFKKWTGHTPKSYRDGLFAC